jgi:hypothetical protein
MGKGLWNRFRKPFPLHWALLAGCLNQVVQKLVDRRHPQKTPQRRSSATPHKEVCEDGGEMPVFQQPPMPH